MAGIPPTVYNLVSKSNDRRLWSKRDQQLVWWFFLAKPITIRFCTGTSIFWREPFMSSKWLNVRHVAAVAIALALPFTADASTIDNFDLGPYQVIRPVRVELLDGSGESIAELPIDPVTGEGLSSSNPLHALHSAAPDAMLEAAYTEGEPVTIQFDLGSLYNISELWLWQYNAPGELDRGMNHIEISFKDDQGNVMGSSIVTSLPLGSGEPLTGSYFCPFIDCIRFVELRILDNYGDSRWVGLSDIALGGREKKTAVPEASAMSMALLALTAIADGARRRRVRPYRRRYPPALPRATRAHASF
jgi:hypothetical protein